MEHFVTLFDSLFLPQGVALYMSMERHIINYKLWVLCVDDKAFEVLSAINFSNMHLLRLGDLETEDLLEVKPKRSKGEYCWTLTPFTPRFVFAADPEVHRVTYIDADIWFRRAPTQIFSEFDTSEKDVLITDHGYAPEYDQSATSGQYCVQFMTFTRRGGEPVRSWWENRCIEWCYARAENGKFGDQKYLDDWPERFPEIVHVLKNKELTLAPWNSTRYPYSSSIFFHFHGLRIVNDKEIVIGFYNLPQPLIQGVYTPYLADLKEAVRLLEKVGFKYKSQAPGVPVSTLLYNLLRSIYLVFKSNVRTGRIEW